MRPTILVNGAPGPLSAADRGLAYGDGLFETMFARDGGIPLLAAHMARLLAGCERLAITPPSTEQILADVSSLLPPAGEYVVKLILTRGAGGRGYRPPEEPRPTRIVALYPAPPMVALPLKLIECRTPLGHNPVLAGLKHLCRLEQVLGQAEVAQQGADEGIMFCTSGNAICATSGNLFMVRERALVTPDLSQCGIRGIMRDMVMTAASSGNFSVQQSILRRDDLLAADEIFLTNAVRGIQPVSQLGARAFSDAAVTNELSAMLGWRRSSP